jgi:maltose alpha-D-glucosyltransferase/alpha-amylase
MLRSFDYAVHAARRKIPAMRASGTSALDRHAMAWQAETRKAFIGGYDEVGQRAGLASPAKEMDGLLELLLLEKALYELAYEAEHRPDWLHIPLSGLLDLLGPAG